MSRQGVGASTLIVGLLLSGATWLKLSCAGIGILFPAATPTLQSACSWIPILAWDNTSFYMMLLVVAVLVGAALLTCDLPAVRPQASASRWPAHSSEFLALRSTHASIIVGGRGAATIVYIAIILASWTVTNHVLQFWTVQPPRGPAENYEPDPSRWPGDILVSVASGLWEEILLIAVPLVFVTIWSRLQWKVLIPLILIAIILRAGIHLYYGFGAFVVIPWMIGAVLLAGMAGSVWPLVLGHAIFDIAFFTESRFQLPAHAIYTADQLIMTLGASIVAVSVIKQFFDTRPGGFLR